MLYAYIDRIPESTVKSESRAILFEVEIKKKK